MILPRPAALLLIALFIVGCQSAAAPTPPMVFVTPAASTSAPVATPPPATATPAAPTRPAPTATARPTPTARPSPTPQPTLRAYVEELTPGSLGLTLEEFIQRWNASEGVTGGLVIREDEWVSDPAADGSQVVQYVFSDPGDDTYRQFALVGSVNPDDSLRVVLVLYMPGDDTLRSSEKLIAISAHSALVDALLAGEPEDVRHSVLAAVNPPPEVSYTGVEASTEAAGVRFRLTDQGSEGVMFIARENNQGD